MVFHRCKGHPIYRHPQASVNLTNSVVLSGPSFELTVSNDSRPKGGSLRLYKYVGIVLAIMVLLAVAGLLVNQSSNSIDNHATPTAATPASPSDNQATSTAVAPSIPSWLSRPKFSGEWAMYDIEPNLVVWFDRHTPNGERKALFNKFVDQMTRPNLENYFATRFSAKNERWQGKLDSSSIEYQVVFAKCGVTDCVNFIVTEHLGKIDGGIPFQFEWRMDMDERTIKPIGDAATDLEQYLPLYEINHMSEEEFLNFRRSMDRSR